MAGIFIRTLDNCSSINWSSPCIVKLWSGYEVHTITILPLSSVMISSWGEPERAAHRVTTEFVIAQSRICHKPTARTATVSEATYAYFTLKSRAEFLMFISLCMALTWSDFNHRCDWNLSVLPVAVGNLPLMICSKQGVTCHVYFKFSCLNSRY